MNPDAPVTKHFIALPEGVNLFPRPEQTKMNRLLDMYDNLGIAMGYPVAAY